MSHLCHTQGTDHTSPMVVRTFLTASGVARSAAIRTLESRTSPRMRVPWFTVGFDGFFHVTREVLIDNRVCAAGFKRGYHFGDFRPFTWGVLKTATGRLSLSMTIS